MTLLSLVVRVVLILWIVERMRSLGQPDYEIGKLQKQIKFWRKINEELGMHVVELEQRHAQLVGT